MTSGNCELIEQGESYPRTCRVCKLGPCTKKKSVSVSDLSLIDEMLNYRAREITKALDARNDDLLAMWRTMTIVKFLERFRAMKEDN